MNNKYRNEGKPIFDEVGKKVKSYSKQLWKEFPKAQNDDILYNKINELINEYREILINELDYESKLKYFSFICKGNKKSCGNGQTGPSLKSIYTANRFTKSLQYERF